MISSQIYEDISVAQLIQAAPHVKIELATALRKPHTTPEVKKDGKLAIGDTVTTRVPS